jgi:hypothetical protein
MANVRDIIPKVRRPETTARICLRGDLNAEHEALERRLAELDAGGGQWVPDSLSATRPDESDRLDLAEKVTAVEREMAEAEVEFRFRASRQSDWRALRDAHPGRPDRSERLFNTDTFPVALVAAAAVEPVIDSLADAESLFEVLSEGQRDRLFTAAWKANNAESDVPKSTLASAVIRSTAPR